MIVIYSVLNSHMNEVRFSNYFIEKRTFHFREALPLQGFPILHFGTIISVSLLNRNGLGLSTIRNCDCCMYAGTDDG